MNQVIRFPGTPFEAVPRAAIVNEMAMHLIAGMTAGLDVSSDFEVIRYLKSTPEQYRAKIISFHLDDARYLAQQTVITSVFGER